MEPELVCNATQLIAEATTLFYEKGVLKNFAKFTGNTCGRAWGIQLYLKRDSCTYLFLWILRTFLRTLILKNISKQLLLWLFYLYDGNIYFNTSLAKIAIWYFLKKWKKLCFSCAFRGCQMGTLIKNGLNR